MERDFKHRKSLGQNFLFDKNILAKEVRIANLTGVDVVEIGPGEGTLTQAILDAKPKSLTVIEKDARLISNLREKFPSISIIEGDVLEVEFPPCDVVMGNIPYYISSPIIFMLKDLPISRAILMVQKEFAKKMVATCESSNYGRLSVTSQLFFNVSYEMTVSRRSFVPPPKVDSALISLVPTKLSLSSLQEDVLRAMFSHKNKTLKNALKDGNFERYLDVLTPWLERRSRTLSVSECREILACIGK